MSVSVSSGVGVGGGASGGIGFGVGVGLGVALLLAFPIPPLLTPIRFVDLVCAGAVGDRASDSLWGEDRSNELDLGGDFT